MKSRWLPYILLFCFSVWVLPVHAQTPAPITASVDRDTLSINETIQLTVTILTNSLAPVLPDMPALDDFEIVGTNSGSQLNIVNGQISSSNSYVYILQPRKSGELTIGAFSLTLNGQNFQTEPIKMTVTKDQSSPASGQTTKPGNGQQPADTNGQDFFVDASVDNPEPYIGQMISYIVRFYQAANVVGQPYYDAPKFTGFWSVKETKQSQGTDTLNGRPYQVSELRTFLFPTAAGQVTIDPAKLTMQGGFFEPDINLQSKPITVNVKSLPDGAPEGFKGAVGQYEIKANMSTTQGKVNEPLTLKITLSGKGNFNNLPEPIWQDIPDWRTFESKASAQSTVQANQIQGSRIFERLLVPSKEGKYSLPPVQYIFFDPIKGEYQTIRTQPVQITILPGQAEAPSPQAVLNPQADVKQLAEDIRYLKPVPSVLAKAESTNPPLTVLLFYWLAWGLPLLFLAGYLFWEKYRQRLESDSGWTRRMQARKNARRTLEAGRKGSDDVYHAVALALTDFLSDKFNQPVAGLTSQALAELLSQKNISTELSQRVQDCLFKTEVGRFAPEAGNPTYAENLLDEAEKLIDELENRLP